jgi:hypothetical protein
MQTVRAVVSTAIRDSARVQQVAGMFDLGVPPRVEETFEVQLPGPDEEWRIGAIVGPSGSGKSSVAREAFGEGLFADRQWPARRAIVISRRKYEALLPFEGRDLEPYEWVDHFLARVGAERK